MKETLLGRGRGDSRQAPLRTLPPGKFGSRRSSGVGILAVGLSHGINIPSSITVNLKGSLEVHGE